MHFLFFSVIITSGLQGALSHTLYEIYFSGYAGLINQIIC